MRQLLLVMFGSWLSLASCSGFPSSDKGDGAKGGGAGKSSGDEGGRGEAGQGGASAGDSDGSSGPPTPTSCTGLPSPCGGDPVGNWKIEKSCLLDLVGTFSCAGVHGDGSKVLQSGTMTFGADNTYTSLTAIAGPLEVTYPPECTGGLDCKSLAMSFATALPSGYRTEECVSVSGGCSCVFEVDIMNIVDRGIYAPAGNVINMTSAQGVSIQVDYCVRGSEMTLVSRNPSTGTTAQISWLAR